MSINLQKGQKINLSKDAGSSLTGVMVGLGWDPADDGASARRGLRALFGGGRPQDAIDCDASVILCGADGKLVDPAHTNSSIVYYGNLIHPSGAVRHQGDNLTGEGEGDDEQILIDLPRVPADIARLVFVVNIYDAGVRNQHFGMLRNAFIRLVDQAGGRELCRYTLDENYSAMTGLVVGELYRHGGDWKFNAIGQPVREASRVDALLRMYL